MVQRWELASGRRVGEPRKYHHPVDSLAYTPDGHSLLVGQSVLIQETEAGTGQLRRDIAATLFYRTGLPIDRDGRHLAFAVSDRTVRVWDLRTWRKVNAFRGHTDEVAALTFSPDGRRLASGGKDRTIKVWDLTRGHEVRVLNPLSRISGGLAFSPNRPWLAAAANRSGDSDDTEEG